MLRRTVEELRAIVGEDGRDVSDEQLLAWDAQAIVLVDLVWGLHRDRHDPVGAADRRRVAEAPVLAMRARRRVKYERERARRRTA